MRFPSQEYWSGLPLQEIPTQGLNPGIPHCRQILYQLSHKGNPRILEWIVYPSSSGSSQLRNRTGVLAWQADSLPNELSGKFLAGTYGYFT